MTVFSHLRRAGWRSALALLALLGSAGAASAASYTVLNNGGSGAGSLSDALASAAGDGDASDTITFDPGVTGTIALGGTELAIGKSMTITGPGANVLTLDAGGSSRIFNITAGTVAISGLTLNNGHSSSHGGAMVNTGTLTVSDCVLSGNSGQYGGGVSNEGGGTLTLRGDIFTGDSAIFSGGGLFNASGAAASVTNCTFSGNTATYGGGLLNVNTATITSCTFVGNTGSAGNAGGLYAIGATTVTACLFAGSTSGDLHGSVTSGGSNLLGDGNGNGITGGQNHDQTGVSASAAQVGALANNGGPTQTCALLTGSPAIDADYSSSTATDQRGYSRPAGVRSDIGAYEAGASAPHVPATLIVTNNLDDGSTGSLRMVLAAAGPGDTVTFASNVTGTIALNGTELAISQDVTIAGPGANVLAVDAGGSSRVFDITAGTVVISGLTLQNGSASGSVTTGGGGAIDNAGALTVTGCVLSANTAVFGGAIFDEDGSALTLTDSTFSGNSSQRGGSVVWCAQSSTSSAIGITGCTFSGNAAGDGGAVTNEPGCAVTVTDSTFSGNTAGYGELCNDGGTVTVTSCTLSGNIGTVLVGGINNNGGTLILTATLFAGNTDGDIVSGNGGTVVSGGSNLLGDGDEYGIVGGTNHDQTGITNAMLGALASNGGPTQTCAVLAGSPAIGGDYALLTATDQRGVVRASHTVGAFEYVAPAPLLPAARTHVLWNNTDGRVMLWNVDAMGGITQNFFGPYDDTQNVGVPGNTGVWHATALATGPDGMNHLLWNNPDGRVMLWTVDDAGNFTLAGYGPYTDDSVGTDPSVNKWHAVGVSVGADNTTHLLWDNTDGRMMLWNVDQAFNFTLAGFGPYDDTPNIGVPGNTGVWHAVALATGPDNISRIAWNNPDGRAMLWNVDSAFGFTLAGFGPYTDDSVGSDPSVNKWSTVGVSVGADNATHLLWGNTDRRMMLWNVDGYYGFSLAGFGPYTDDSVGADPSVNLWSATALATGGDNVSRVLWGNTDARMMLWDVDGLFNFTLAGYGPYTDILPGGTLGGQWTATAVSAAP